MKKILSYLLAVSCVSLCLAFFSSCEEDEDPIVLESISKLYEGDELKAFWNGEEYDLRAVVLTVPSLVPEYTPGTDIAPDEMILLELPPLWPDVSYTGAGGELSNIVVEMKAASSSDEVLMKGSYTNSDKYTLDVEGSWRDGVLTLQLIYAENVPSLTGNAYIFDFSKESIDLTYLNPKVYEIEHDGQWIPIKEFVRDAMAPFYRTIRNRLGGPVRIEFFPDGSMQIGVKAEGESTFTPVVGKHKYFYHERRTSIYWGFLSADVEGAKWMTKAILGGFWSVPYLFYSCVMDSDKYFAPFHFQERPKEEKSLLMTYEEPSMTRFRYSFYSLVLFHYGTEDADDEPRDMSYEETRKCLKVADLLSKKDIQFIYLRGVKDSLDE